LEMTKSPTLRPDLRDPVGPSDKVVMASCGEGC
jgi:hypothetical protein